MQEKEGEGQFLDRDTKPDGSIMCREGRLRAPNDICYRAVAFDIQHFPLDCHNYHIFLLMGDDNLIFLEYPGLRNKVLLIYERK